MKMRQSILIGSSVVLAIAGLLLVPYKGLGRLQAMLFGCGAITGFVGGVKGRKLEEEQENWESQILEAKDHQKMLEQSTLEVLQMEEVAIARSRSEANVQLQTLQHQQHLQTVKQLRFPGLLEAEMEEARRRSEIESNDPQKQAYAIEGGSTALAGEAIGTGAIGAEMSNQDKGLRLLQRLRKSDMSVLVVGSTGAGKSHTLSAYLEFLYQDFPDADVSVISRKNDSFCGLREAGRVVRFNSLNPVEALDKLREIHAIFQERTEALEEDRAKLTTIRLILEDWSSICLILKKNKLIWDEVQIILSDIVTVGRELNIALFILAQSANLESLGLVGDANLRTCLAIVAQGLESINNKGERQGDYNLVQLILKNAYIIPSDEERKSLTNELSDLIAESRKTKQPVFLCTGGEAFVGLLPKITKAILPVGRQPDRAIQGDPIDSDVNPKPPIKLDIEAQRKALTHIYELPDKEITPWDEWLSESSTEEIDRLIDERRSRRDTPPDATSNTVDTASIDVSDTSEPKNVCDTSQGSYREPEPLCSKEPLRMWGTLDFGKYLPDHDEFELFEQLCSYQDTSRAGSEIIKRAWKFSSGVTYRRIGQPCFVYIVNKHGSEAQKEFYAPFIKKCLAANDNDSE